MHQILLLFMARLTFLRHLVNIVSISLQATANLFAFSIFVQTVAESVGDWYFDRTTVKAIDCPYPCDKTCHNLIFK